MCVCEIERERERERESLIHLYHASLIRGGNVFAFPLHHLAPQCMAVTDSPKDTTGASKWRHHFPHSKKGLNACDVRNSYEVRMMGLLTGLHALGILDRVEDRFALRDGRRIAFVKLDCEYLATSACFRLFHVYSVLTAPR